MTEGPSADSRARPAEIIFEVTEAVEGGYDARALGYSIYTQGENWDDLKEMAREAVLCHFDEDESAARDPPALRSGKRPSRYEAAPRPLGRRVARRLVRHYGCRATRSRSTHMTVTLTAEGDQHQVTVPRHRSVRIDTPNALITDVAAFLCLPKQAVRDTLFD